MIELKFILKSQIKKLDQRLDLKSNVKSEIRFNDEVIELMFEVKIKKNAINI